MKSVVQGQVHNHPSHTGQDSQTGAQPERNERVNPPNDGCHGTAPVRVIYDVSSSFLLKVCA